MTRVNGQAPIVRTNTEETKTKAPTQEATPQTIVMSDDSNVPENKDTFERQTTSDSDTSSYFVTTEATSEETAAIQKRALEAKTQRENSQLYQLTQELNSTKDPFRIVQLKTDIISIEKQRLSEDRLTDNEKSIVNAALASIKKNESPQPDSLSDEDKKILATVQEQLNKIDPSRRKDITPELITILMKDAQGKYDDYGAHKEAIMSNLMLKASRNVFLVEDLSSKGPKKSTEQLNRDTIEDAKQEIRNVRRDQARIKAGYDPATRHYIR